jgi:endonuclease YncB( thermonuclease family)
MMTKIRYLIIILTILVSASISFAFQGKVVRVIDGDTIVILNIDNEQTKVRLYGIDSPESKQAFGTRSKQFLSKLIFGQVVAIVDMGNDRYGRTIGKIYLDDQYINLMMVQAGMAWWYKQYSKRDTELSLAQTKAQKQQLGLWIDPKAVAPWEFRAKKKDKN